MNQNNYFYESIIEIEELSKKIQYDKNTGFQSFLNKITGKKVYTRENFIEDAKKIILQSSVDFLELFNGGSKAMKLERRYFYGYSENFDTISYSMDDLEFIVKPELRKKFENYINLYIKTVPGEDDKSENELDFNIVEDYPVLYLNNEDRFDYLKRCMDYIEDIKKKPIFKHSSLIKHIAALNTFSPLLDNMLRRAGADIQYNLFQHYGGFMYVDTYIESKLKNIQRDFEKTKSGIEGEGKVNKYLEMYNDEFINLSNIRLEVEENSIENDNILITPYGIYVIEVKNLGSTGKYSLNISKDGKWSRVTNTKSETIEFNAAEQNERHIRYLQKFINDKLGKTHSDEDYLKVKGFIVIANNEVDIHNESEQPIYRMSEIYRQISKGEKILSVNEMEKIKEIILKDSLRSKKYMIPDYLKELKDNMDILNLHIDQYNLKIQDIGTMVKIYVDLNEALKRLRKLPDNTFEILVNNQPLFGCNHKILNNLAEKVNYVYDL